VTHHLTCSIVESLAVITLSNPPQNRLTEQMVGELDSAIAAIAHNGARAVLVNADGDNFSYGGDISPWPDMDAPELRALFERYMTVFNSFECLPIPVIAAVQGLCLGGGFELILRSDVVFATPSTYFGHPEKTLGLVTLLGGIYRVAERVGRNKAIEWALTGERLPASVMADAGIVNHIVDEGNLVDVATEFARAAASGPTRAHAAHKALLRAWALGGVATADQTIFDIAMPLFDTADTRSILPASVHALANGLARPDGPFRGQ
jgi:enoyl-CoA hydratase/carnithine racemase